MTPERHQIEVWIVMNNVGEYVVASDESTASDLADQELDEEAPRRHIKLELKLAPPNGDVSFTSFEIEEQS